VGVRLKKARERRGISLRQVADSTKISVFVLQALERDDVSNLPGGVVGRGFVRSFAAAVHLDPEATVAAFVAQFPEGSLNDGYPAAARADGNELSDFRPSEVPFRIRRWPSILLRVAAVGVVAAALVVYFVFAPAKAWPQWAALRNTAVAALASFTDSSIRAANLDESSVQAPVTIAAHADSAAPPAVAAARPAAPAPPPATPAARRATPASPAVPAAPRAVTPRTDSSPVVASSAPTVAVATSAQIVTERASTPAGTRVDEPLRVVLSVTSPSWVTVLVDGKKAVSRLFEVGEQETLEANRDLVLTAGDGGAIVMTLNGAVAKPLARTGKTVKVHVDRANFRRYLRPEDAPGESP